MSLFQVLSVGPQHTNSKMYKSYNTNKDSEKHKYQKVQKNSKVHSTSATPSLQQPNDSNFLQIQYVYSVKIKVNKDNPISQVMLQSQSRFLVFKN